MSWPAHARFHFWFPQELVARRFQDSLPLELTPVHVSYGPTAHIGDVRMKGRAGAVAAIVGKMPGDSNLPVFSLHMPVG